MGEYSVQFIHADKLYRLKPPDLGPWYDVESLLAIVDHALHDSGISERFVPLADTGDCVLLIFAEPGALKAAASELDLRLREEEQM